jgi:hypothetical protein
MQEKVLSTCHKVPIPTRSQPLRIEQADLVQMLFKVRYGLEAVHDRQVCVRHERSKTVFRCGRRCFRGGRSTRCSRVHESVVLRDKVFQRDRRLIFGSSISLGWISADSLHSQARAINTHLLFFRFHLAIKGPSTATTSTDGLLMKGRSSASVVRHVVTKSDFQFWVMWLRR